MEGVASLPLYLTILLYMKQAYKDNPLETFIELNEKEKKEFWYKLKIKEM